MSVSAGNVFLAFQRRQEVPEQTCSAGGGGGGASERDGQDGTQNLDLHPAHS